MYSRLPIKKRTMSGFRTYGSQGDRSIAYAAARQRARSMAFHMNRRLPMTRQAVAAEMTRPLRRTNLNTNQRGELKYVDTAAAAYACDTVGTVTLLNGVAPGVGISQRVGRRINIRSIQVTGSLSTQDAEVVASQVKVALIMDMEPGAAVPAITDIYTASTSTAFHNLDYRDRFKTIATYQAAFGALSTVATQAYCGSPTNALVNIYKRCNIPVTFKGDDALIGSIATNAVYLVTIGNHANGTGYVFYGAVRIRYDDA